MKVAFSPILSALAGLWCLSSTPAFSQERVVVWDFNQYHAGTIIGSGAPPKNAGGEALTILGMFPGQTSADVAGVVAQTLSPIGYVKSEYKKTDSCAGKWVFGESSSRLSEVVLSKAADGYVEKVHYEVNGSYSGTSQMLFIERYLTYASPEKATRADEFVADLTKRYGAPYQTTSANGSRYPTMLTWRDPKDGQDLNLAIDYYSADRDKVSSFRMFSKYTLYDKLSDVSRYLCPPVRDLDRKKQLEVDRDATRTAPKF